MTLKQALWEIVRDENIIITNQNIDWLLDRALKRASGDAQALKESILERKGGIEENIPCALTNEEKVSEKDKLLLINEDKSNNFEVKSNEELFKQALIEGLNRRFDREIEEAKKIEQIEEMARDICKLGISCEECTMLARKTNQTREQYCKAFEYAKRAYNAGYRKQEWISVEDRLPTYKDGKVLIYTAYGISIGEKTVSNRWRGDNAIPKQITHWMPLPEAPKMKGGE